jgi:peptidoglycan hydrolase-like protein with peptidoglycan-binding domain
VKGRWLAGAGGAAAAAAVAGLVVLGLGRGGAEAEAAETEPATGLARIVRRDLVLRESVDGTLGYDDARALAAPMPGTVTALRDQGAVIRRGGVLLEVNGRPVRLLYGEEPLWRRLGAGIADGADVRQLERNLTALGYEAGTVDADFDADTKSAILAWQEDIGAVEDGAVDPGEAVFLPGARRVGDVTAVVGAQAQPGVELLTTTSTRRVVTVDLDARQQTLVAEGDSVRVGLPTGRTVAGTVRSVGSVAETSAEAAAAGETDPTIEVQIALRGGGQAGGLDGAPVTVEIESDRARNALAVPVEALLALRGGGFALELVENDVRRLSAVETGTFADGWVEVRGRGLREGMSVVVPA